MKEFAGIARPGDTVVIALARRMTDEELSDFREDFEGFLDQTGVHLAIVEGVSQMLIVRPGDDVEGIDKEFPVTLGEALSGKGDGGVVR